MPVTVLNTALNATAPADQANMVTLTKREPINSSVKTSLRRLVFTLLFIGSLFVNVTMFAWSAGAVALSAVFSTVTGITSIVTDLADS